MSRWVFGTSTGVCEYFCFTDSMKSGFGMFFIGIILFFFLPLQKLFMMPTIQGIILLIAMASICNAYYPDLKDPYVPDSVLKDLVDFMSKDIMEDASEEYEESEQLPLSNARLALMARATKDQGERFMDYDSLLDRTNPHPSIRDQEYLQHSSLWGHQFMSGGAAEGKLLHPKKKNAYLMTNDLICVFSSKSTLD